MYVRSVDSDVLSTVNIWRETTISDGSTASVTKGDGALIYRVVGFLEYMTALRYLDPLAREADPEELEAIDEIIKEQPEFTVYTNLAARYSPAPNAGDDSARRGFPWVLALARVELGGSLATFAEYQAPFSMVGPTEYEMDAYRDLLTDGARVHYLSLTRDPFLKRATNRNPDRVMLMYLRRFNVARRFLEAAGGIQAETLTPEQRADFVQRRKELMAFVAQFAATIEAYVAANQIAQQVNTETFAMSRDCRQFCDEMTNATSTEFQRGTARELIFGPRR